MIADSAKPKLMNSATLRRLSHSPTFARNFSLISSAIIIITAVAFFVYIQVVIDDKINGLLEKATSSGSMSGLDSQIANLMVTRSTERYVILGITLTLITTIVVFLSKSNVVMKKIIDERTRDLNAVNKELTEKNKQLELHDRLQTEFINIAAHELRTPIQPIIATAEILGLYKESGQEKEKVLVEKSDLQLIGRNAARLERLSSDILDVTRIESGSFRLNKNSLDLIKLVKEAIEDAKRSKEIENVRIHFMAPEKSISVTADKQRLLQVISNLLNNSIRFTKPDGMITVSIIEQENEIDLTVSDTGAGIDKTILPRLFTKFSSTTKASSGTGLGLYLCKAIIEAHGGTISGYNNASGKGATFSFTIPSQPILVGSGPSMEHHFEMENSVIIQLAKEAFGAP